MTSVAFQGHLGQSCVDAPSDLGLILVQSNPKFRTVNCPNFYNYKSKTYNMAFLDKR